MANNYDYGILQGGTGSFGSLQWTDKTADNRVEIFDESKNLKAINSVSASTTIQGGNATFASAKVSDLTSGRVLLAGTSGELEDSANLTFDGSNLSGSGQLQGASVAVDGDISGDNGSFSGNMTITGDLTVNGTTTTVNSTAVSIGDRIIELNSAGASGPSGFTVYDYDSPETTGSLLYDSTEHRWMGGVTGSESILVDRGSNESITGTKTFTSIVATSADINGGTVDGANVTVGSGKTLDVSAGTLTLAAGQVGADKVGAGTFDAGTYSFNGSTISNLGSVTTADINGGTIDGATIATSDITVGSSKTLDVSAGTLTLADDQISGDKVEGGTITATTITTLTSTTVNATNVSASGYVSASSFEVDGQASISYDSSALDFSSGDAGAKLSTTMFSASVELQGPTMEVSGAAKVGSLTIGGTAVTATAAEINYLDNDDLTAADITKLAALDATAAEINILDGDTAASSVTVADADRIVLNDGGTMKQVAMTDFETYFESALDTLSNVTTVGDLDAGSITSNFGNVDIGTSTLDAGNSTLASLKVSDLTETRIVFAGASGELQDNANLTFSGSNLVVTTLAYMDGGIEALSDISSSVNLKAGGNLNVAGISEFADYIDVAGAGYFQSNVEVTGNLAVNGNLTFDTGVSVVEILDQDDMNSDSATALATQQSIKAYVDSQVGDTALTGSGDSGTFTIDLNSQTLSIAGTSNEIETAGSGQTLTIGLPDDVTIGGTLNVTSALTASGDIVAGDNITLKTGGNTVILGESGNKLSAVYATNVYTGDFHMKNERGDWTLFEESDYLRIRNNKTGQEFRMDMTPIEE